MTTPRAPSSAPGGLKVPTAQSSRSETTMNHDSPKLLPCPFCGNPAERTQRDNKHSIIYKVECTHCYASVTDDEAAMYADAAWNRRATPPAQSARPNEATLQAACAAYTVALSRYGSNLQRESAHEVGMRAALRAANEADAPRGQAVAHVPTRDLERFMAHESTSFRAAWAGVNIFSEPTTTLYLAPPPSPVGEADGVREKYRATTEHDARKILDEYRRLLDEKYTSCTMCAMWTALSSIGAVVPNEVHVPQEGK